MKIRFRGALLSLVLVALNASTFAAAPVINFLRSPIIVDDLPATTPNWYVWPDALNLDALGTDDTTVTASILWSYTGPNGVQGRYRLNGRDAILPASEDPNAPGAKDLRAGDDSGPNGADTVGGGLRDGNVRTVTLRDASLSPLGGANAPMAGGPGARQSEVVTLFASDGTTYSYKSALFYTENVDSTVDRFLITTPPPPDPIPGSNGWLTVALLGAPTFSGNTSAGLCMTVPAGGDNFGMWISPYNVISLTANTVYRIRLTMDDNTASAMAAGRTPLWDFVIDNFDSNSPATTENKYSCDFINLDNMGGANALADPNPNSAGQTTSAPAVFDIYFTPPPVRAADWNDASTGEFVPAHDAKNDMRLIFRILDVNVPGANDATLDAGTLCIRSIAVASIPLASLLVQQNLYDLSNFAANNNSVVELTDGHSGTVQILGGPDVANSHTIVDYAGGACLIAPNVSGTFTDGSPAQFNGGSHAWDVSFVSIAPGDSATGGAANDDNWPFLWTPNQLLMGTVVAEAPNAQAAVNPPDGLQLAWDSPGTELLQGSYILATANTLGMPKPAPTAYTSLFFTHAGSNESAAIANHDNRLRFRVDLANTQSISSGGQARNTGGVKITELRVDQMETPN